MQHSSIPLNCNENPSGSESITHVLYGYLAMMAYAQGGYPTLREAVNQPSLET